MNILMTNPKLDVGSGLAGQVTQELALPEENSRRAR